MGWTQTGATFSPERPCRRHHFRQDPSILTQLNATARNRGVMMPRTWTVPATVVEVVDGDTVRLVLDLGWHITYTCRCRIALINAPEMKEAAGVSAKAYAQTLLAPGDTVEFRSTTLDKYGRPLGRIRFGPDSLDFGAEMVEAGHAVYVDW